MKKMEYVVMGLMSGTSLDGLDIAMCSFQREGHRWKYDLIYSKTYNYSKRWKESLANASQLSADKLIKFDREYGNYLGSLINKSIKDAGIEPDLIASHGHTVFHNPDKGYSLQIGHGANIAGITEKDVVTDFRSGDIAIGGQGAPLVPVGDKLLFGEYQSCLNLGGFSNISFDIKNERIAFDICPVNIVLNDIAVKMGFEYDCGGTLGRKGKAIRKLEQKLNSLAYYDQAPPKSLSKEWMDKFFLPLLKEESYVLEDQIKTMYKHIAFQIASSIDKYNLKDVFITGGGAHNSFLIELLKVNTKANLILPEKAVIDYKEAIVFAFLGLLRSQNIVNCYASVTGALNNSIVGTVYHG